ncbi:hypothetical protein [Nostoc sphaeroides]|uniref:hypothetical protein n=1 Tax=Nostoc sphaeroides TaxID=446679 RepID=UPI001269F8F9|nr:hypothetical protein [Nostoc sphaeroides]
MWFRTISSIVGLLVSTSLTFATDAQAAPFNSPGYPNYTYEGKYPEATPCRYNLLQSKKATWTGSTITLKYFYSDGCGSFARIENAPPYCSVYLDRTRSTNPNPTRWDYVGETVDPGINFAYTKVGNNLSGRLSRAALVCGTGTVVTRTNWY